MKTSKNDKTKEKQVGRKRKKQIKLTIQHAEINQKVLAKEGD